MCGIAGIVRMGKQPIPEETLALLLTGNEHRGNDASGLAIAQNNGDVAVFKRDIPAWKFVSEKEYFDFLKENLRADSWAVILHARAATKGNPRENNNNHPMFAGQTAVVHNGIIHNDDHLFKEMKLERRAETDSDILRAILDEYGFTEKGMKELSRVVGAAAGAAVSPKYPQKMLLFKSGTPMKLACTEDFLLFSSELKTLHKASRPMVTRFGMWFQMQHPQMAFGPVAEDTVYLVGKNGFETHMPFKAHTGFYHEPNRRTYKDWESRQTKWDKEKLHTATKKLVEAAWCSTCKKSWMITQGTDPKDWFCPKERQGCGGTLEKMPEETHAE